VVDGAGYMSGDGLLSVTGGYLMDGFGPMGEMFDVTFRLDLMDIDDFSTAFTGESDLTIIPTVPEPSTLLLLAPALFSFAAILRKKFRSPRV
ncbi:MAG: PEP-CTERM sorting domain-containing protein, partial [Planctomycetota bacterium]